MLCAVSVRPSCPSASGCHRSPRSLHSSVFPGAHRPGILQPVSFPDWLIDWLIERRSVHLRFPVSLPGLRSSCLPRAEQHPRSGRGAAPRSPAEGHLGLLPSLGNYASSRFPLWCVGFCVDLCFQPLWVTSKGSTCWIVQRECVCVREKPANRVPGWLHRLHPRRPLRVLTGPGRGLCSGLGPLSQGGRAVQLRF